MRLNHKWKSKEVRHNVFIELDACNLGNLPHNTMTLYVEDTVQVRKDIVSGIAAIMYALAIARDRDPQTINFNYKHLRQKLSNCLTNLSFSSITFADSPHGQWKRKFKLSVSLFCHCNRLDMGDPTTKCGTCTKWYHMSCEDGDSKLTDWKCKICYNSNRIDMEQKVEHIYVDDAVSPLSDSSTEQEYVELSWKELVNRCLMKNTAALPNVDHASFTRFLTRSVKDAWFLGLN